jgi:hypothetical protein
MYAAILNVFSQTKNAREGITTVPGRIASGRGSFRSQTKNAREGITTAAGTRRSGRSRYLPNKKCPPVLTVLVRARALRLRDGTMIDAISPQPTNKKCPPVLTVLVRARALRHCFYVNFCYHLILPNQKCPPVLTALVRARALRPR